jgi:hypothetical protein
MNEPLKTSINQIAAYLSYGFDAHRKLANELRGLPKRRGYARWHEAEAEEDALYRLSFDKLVRDNIGYTPAVDANYVATAAGIQVPDETAFQRHFTDWIAREDKFLTAIMAGINAARDEDVALYNLLCNMAGMVKNERIRAKWVYDGLVYVGWQPHHIAVESLVLHEYFEHKWKPGEPIDFNVG